MKKTYSYSGIAFKQNAKAPELFAFVAPAEQLVEFCGVARKSEKLLTNYQRALDDQRVDREVVPFFRIPENCTPTAIVISLHQTPLAEFSFVDVKDPDGGGLNLKRMQISFVDPDTLSTSDVIAEAKNLLDSRLATESREVHSAIPTTESTESDIDDVDEDDLADDDVPDDDAEIEIGTSMLRELRKRLDEASEAESLVDVLRDMLKPALIIDGQHRTFGAAKLEEGIPLLVCALVKPDWKEQVFQFTVINDKAEGIPKPFITSLAGMSLTSIELAELQTRLAQAGVQLWEVEVMQRLGYDSRSAFFGKIEFKTTGAGNAGLGYQTMKQVGKAWYEPKSAGLEAVYRVLYEGDKKASKKELVSQWQKSEDWFKYFCMFWDHIKERFESTPLWETHSSLMTAVVLLQLQQSYLKSLGNFASLTIKKIVEGDPKKRAKLVEQQFREITEQWFSKFTEKTFPQQWGVKSLNHKDGKTKLLDYFDKVADGSNVKNHSIISGK